MPIEPHPDLFVPQGDNQIVKYLDLTKFISLLQRKALFFCRLDKLEDRFEGTAPKANIPSRKEWYRRVPTRDYTEDEIDAEVREYIEFEKKLKSLHCINCWNRNDSESAALWKIYSGLNNGIMIMSSVQKLDKSLKAASQTIYCSEIKYHYYDQEPIPEGNTFYPIIHKQKAYNYEEELRLIHMVSQQGWVHDWSKEEVEEGVYIQANLDELITEIVISPHAPNWFFKMVEGLTEVYGLDKPVRKSSLTPP